MTINSKCESYDYNVYGPNIKSEIQINEFMKNKSEDYDSCL